LLSLVFQLMNREEPAVIAKPIPLLGGKSVFCINEEQMYEATRLREENFESSQKINTHLKRLEQNLNRNEQAALAFTLIERLKKNA
jgi:hypothetical protein